MGPKSGLRTDMSNKYKEFEDFGALGGKQKGINFKKLMIDRLSALCTKSELNFYQGQNLTGSALQEIYLVKLKQKDEKRNVTS